jgi:hypothetical protein
MTPLSFEWQWNADYFIFMGLLYLALVILGCGLIYAYVKTWFDIDKKEEDLPSKIPHRSKYSDY